MVFGQTNISGLGLGASVSGALDRATAFWAAQPQKEAPVIVTTAIKPVPGRVLPSQAFANTQAPEPQQKHLIIPVSDWTQKAQEKLAPVQNSVAARTHVTVAALKLMASDMQQSALGLVDDVKARLPKVTIR